MVKFYRILIIIVVFFSSHFMWADEYKKPSAVAKETGMDKLDSESKEAEKLIGIQIKAKGYISIINAGSGIGSDEYWIHIRDKREGEETDEELDSYNDVICSDISAKDVSKFKRADFVKVNGKVKTWSQLGIFLTKCQLSK